MIFTREQFNEMGEFDIDEVCIDLSGDTDLHIFNSLDSDLQGLAVQWGFGDTVFRDNVYE